MIEQSVKSKKRTLDPVATRTKILDVSARLFSEKGYDAVSFAQIAKETGLPKSLIAYHFGTKEELWAAITSHLLRPGIEMMDRFLRGEIEVGELLRMRLNIFARNPIPARFIAWSSLAEVPLPPFLSERKSQLQDRIHSVDPETVSRCLLAIALMDGWYLNRKTYALLLGEDAIQELTDERILQEVEKLIPTPTENPL